MSFLRKVENFWYYYKWQVMIIAVVIIALFALTTTLDQENEPSDVEVLTVYSAFVSDEEINFQAEFEDDISDVDKNGKSVIYVEQSYITPESDSDYDAMEIAKFEGNISTANSDLILMDEYNYKRFAAKDYYEDLSKYIDVSQFEDENVLYRNGIPAAIRLRDSKILKAEEFKTDNLYAGIMFVPENADEQLLAKRKNAAEILMKLAEE